VGLSTATVTTSKVLGEILVNIDGAVEAKSTVGEDINPLSPEVSRGVDDADVSGLDEVVGDEKVLSVRCDLDVVRSNDALILIGVVETLGAGEVGDIKSRNVVGKGDSEVSELAILGDISAIQLLVCNQY